MAGIGEASAVIGVVQVGISLARTLSTYIGDYKDSRDSIIGLAVQLETTILHVRELNTLVRSNEAAGSVSEDSRKVAENAVTSSKRLIEKLVKLLTKADLPDDPDAIINIKPGDIDVRTLTKFYWPLIKPQVDVVNLELQSMKTEILLARSCIQAQAGSTPAERAAGEESIVALTKSKRLARRLLKEAKAEEKRAAMSTQQPDYVPRPPSGRYRPPERYSSGPYRSGTYDSVSDDGRETDRMARDLRESILEDLQRKDAERKAKERAEEAARKLAIEDYQQMVKEKLARLQKATDATQRRMREIFGPHLDEKLVQKFLDEQRSGQMQDEFEEMLLKIGIVPPLPPMDLTGDAGAGSPGKDSVRKPKRRWFFKRHPSRSSKSTSVSNDAASVASSKPRPSDRTKFLHVVMSYDSVEGKYSYQTLDDTALRHQPCGPTCDFDETLRAWQALPRSVKQAASSWVDENFSHRTWHLHAALPIQKDIRTTRRLLQRAVLGAVAHQGVASILLVFSSTEKYVTSETSAVRGSVSSSSDTWDGMYDGGASRVDLSQADMEQMREWLTTKGLSAEKIAELEALVVKQKESAAAAAATQASMRRDQSSPQRDNTGDDPTDATVQAVISRPGAASHVRFVSGDVAPSMRQKSDATTVASRRSNSGYNFHRRPEPYQTSTHDGLRQDYRDGSPQPPPHRLPEHASDAPKNPFEHYRYDPTRRHSSRRIDDPLYRVNSHQNAYDRRDPREPNRTLTGNEWERRDRHPQTYRQYGHDYNTSLDSSRNPFLPPPRSGRSGSRSRDHRSRLSYELAEELAEDRAGTMPDRRRRSPDPSPKRGGSDTSSRSRGRRRSSERHVVRHKHIKPMDSRRYQDDSMGPEASSLGRPVRIIERTQPATRERREIITNPYNDYSLHQRIYPGSTQMPLSLDPDMFSIPRQLSPEPMADDASDAEDAELDDAELKNKMLVKYTGGTVANTPAEPGRMSDKSHGPDAEQDAKVAKESVAGPGAEIDDEDTQWGAFQKKIRDSKKRAMPDLEPTPGLSTIEPASPDSQTVARPVSTSPIPGVQRHNTVTVEDYDSDAETGAHRSRTRSSPHRATSSPSSASSARHSPMIGPQPLEPRTSSDTRGRDTVEEVD